MDRFVTSLKEKYLERRTVIEDDVQWPPVTGDRQRLINLKLVEADKIQGFGEVKHFSARGNGKQPNNDKIKRTPIFYTDLFKNYSGKERIRKIIVEGNAGIGKTTLCTMLAEGWAEGKCLTQFDCVLLLPLRVNLVATSLSELFKLLHSSERICTQAVEELEDKEGEGVLIIADG